jgi:hypothetical protein
MADEHLDRSNPAKFMRYMEKNPVYFREVFGTPFTEEAARRVIGELRLMGFSNKKSKTIIPLRRKIEKKEG